MAGLHAPHLGGIPASLGGGEFLLLFREPERVFPAPDAVGHFVAGPRDDFFGAHGGEPTQPLRIQK